MILRRYFRQHRPSSWGASPMGTVQRTEDRGRAQVTGY